jgi:hypothetical protein
MYSLDENAVYFLDISEGAKCVRKIVTGKNKSLYFFYVLKNILYSRESIYKYNSGDGGETTGPDMSAADLRIKISSLDFAGILKVVLIRYESSSMNFST